MGADERKRLFCGLRLPDGVLDVVAAWQLDQLAGQRIVPRANLHLTLAFLGPRPAVDVDVVVAAVRAAAAAAGPMLFTPRRYRETRSVGMLVLDDEGGAGAMMADDLGRRLEDAGVYRREARPWLPHLTVVRFRRPPRLQPTLPELGPFAPSGAAAFLSRLRPGGAQYEVLESVALQLGG